MPPVTRHMQWGGMRRDRMCRVCVPRVLQTHEQQTRADESGGGAADSSVGGSVLSCFPCCRLRGPDRRRRTYQPPAAARLSLPENRTNYFIAGKGDASSKDVNS